MFLKSKVVEQELLEILWALMSDLEAYRGTVATRFELTF